MIRLSRAAAGAALLGFIALLPASLAGAPATPIEILRPWARATPPGATTGVAYFSVRVSSADELLSASTPAAARAELHETAIEDGMAQMRHVESIAVDAAHPVTLAPGGKHLMLMGLKGPLVEGTGFPLTLRFRKAGEVHVQVPVAGLGASEPPANASGDASTADIHPVAGMPPVIDAANLYSETGPAHMSPATAGQLARVYVPNLRSNDVYVIDPVTLQVVDRFAVGVSPQHVVPSYDLQTLWVTNNAEGRMDGSLTPIDPRTGKPGRAIPVDDPYNMYFTPDGKSAIVVAEARKRLDFRDAHTMAKQYSIEAPGCAGINHADFAIDGRHAIFTCEFSGSLVRIDLEHRKVAGYLQLKMPKVRFRDKLTEGMPEVEICTVARGMPQDVRASPDGKRFYVADMAADGVHVIDGATFTETGFIVTGVAPHGLYPSRDGKRLYVANRGSHLIHGPARGPGSIAVIEFATDKVVASWKIPEGGSPDMGNVSADGKYLWLSGRYDDVVYRIDTGDGKVDKIKVGKEPHGLTVWPQPGRYSLGHTGNMR